ncbi:hypothetical protein LY76DRAFT_609253 [Colletotrichum caudatum]|nr:hypothetical protein LY76DRAFT_609253 [Colletotrichum caudatum]
MPPQILKNQRDRFKIWAGNLGALQEGRASLDFRLQESTLMKSAVHKLLEQLEKTVTKSIEVVRGSRKPFEESLTSDDEQEHLWRDSDADSSSDDEDGINTRTELGQNTVAIRQIVSDLFKLSFQIRNPATRFDRSHIEEAFYVAVHHTSPTYDSRAESNADKTSPPLKVHDRPITAPEEIQRDFLIDRWSRALTNRRRYFAYWKNHAMKLAREDKGKAPDVAKSEQEGWIKPQSAAIPGPITALVATVVTPAAAASSLAGKSIHSGTEASTYNLKLDDEIDASSVVSYASTAYDIDGTVADLP